MTPVKLQAATWILIGTVRVLQVATALVVLGLSAYSMFWLLSTIKHKENIEINFFQLYSGLIKKLYRLRHPRSIF